MNLLKLLKISIKSDNKNFSTNNSSTTNKDIHYPYTLKADFILSYEQFMRQHTSFYLDLYSRKLTGHYYLLVFTVNNVVIATDNLANIKCSQEVASLISNKCSKSSIIKFKLMHCSIWEKKCPNNIFNFLRSTEAKGSLVRSKLKNYFHKFKPVPGPWGIWPDIPIHPSEKSKYISPQEFLNIDLKKKKKQNKQTNKKKKTNKQTKKTKKKSLITLHYITLHYIKLH
jgi:hypothetical protein